MSSESGSRVTLSLQEAATLSRRALRAIGYDPEQAGIIADHLLDAAMTGYGFAGLPRILAIADERARWAPPREIVVERETAVSARIDGGSNVGYLVAKAATDLVVEKAKAHGMAVVSAYNWFYSGRNFYYAERIAREGLVVVLTASAFPAVVPAGGREMLLGTNPICIAVPQQPDPFIVDMSTAATTHGHVVLSDVLGEQLPEGVAVDSEGNPTRDAAAALEGGILPFGGHKGYGLSLALQVLGLVGGSDLARGQFTDNGLLFMAFDPELLRPLGELETQVSAYIDRVRGSLTQPGVEAVRIPSAQSFARRAESLRRDRIELDAAVISALERLCEAASGS